jgi:hypothetical protein
MVKRRQLDAVGFLTVYLVLLFAIPADLIFKPLGASGTPANVMGIVGFLWWVYAKMLRGSGVARGRQPIRIALLIFGSAILASMAALYTRDFVPKEASALNRGALVFIGSAGVALLIADGVTTMARFQTLLRRLVAGASAVAAVGLLQFATGFDLAKRIKIPGLQINGDLEPWGSRGGFRRVQSTASHPIEFGVVLALIFPIALHLVLVAPKGQRRGRILCAFLLAMGVVTSLSRSGFVALLAGCLMLFAVWSPQMRTKALALAVVFATGMRFLVHGLVGTVLDLFTGISSDSSTTARTGRYGIAGHYIKMHPFFGRGFFTFIPQLYMIFDNQFLLTAVEMGLVGLVALFLFCFIAIFTARGARRMSVDPEARHLAQALAGSMVAATLSFATYDALSFPMATAAVFFLLGCCGALWRFAKEDFVSRSSLGGTLPVKLVSLP